VFGGIGGLFVGNPYSPKWYLGYILNQAISPGFIVEVAIFKPVIMTSYPPLKILNFFY